MTAKVGFQLDLKSSNYSLSWIARLASLKYYYYLSLKSEVLLAAQSLLAYQSYCSSLHQAFVDAPSANFSNKASLLTLAQSTYSAAVPVT